MDLKGTQTEKNLKAAFAGESQARNRYSYYAEKAAEEGRETTRLLFEKMAENERQHAKLWFKLLEKYGTSAENLMQAIAGEHFEWTSMYREFAQTAKDEGLAPIAGMFERVAAIEEDHERRFMKELTQLLGTAEPQETRAKATETLAAAGPVWNCPVCGYNHIGQEPPYDCPICGALGAWEKEQV